MDQFQKRHTDLPNKQYLSWDSRGHTNQKLNIFSYFGMRNNGCNTSHNWPWVQVDEDKQILTTLNVFSLIMARSQKLCNICQMPSARDAPSSTESGGKHYSSTLTCEGDADVA